MRSLSDDGRRSSARIRRPGTPSRRDRVRPHVVPASPDRIQRSMKRLTRVIAFGDESGLRDTHPTRRRAAQDRFRRRRRHRRDPHDSRRSFPTPRTSTPGRCRRTGTGVTRGDLLDLVAPVPVVGRSSEIPRCESCCRSRRDPPAPRAGGHPRDEHQNQHHQRNASRSTMKAQCRRPSPNGIQKRKSSLDHHVIVFSPKPREPPWFAAAHPGITPRVGSGAEFRRSTSRWKSKDRRRPCRSRSRPWTRVGRSRF